MKCPNCDAQIQDGTGSCPHCGHEPTVTVLSRQERDSFSGITIEGEKSDRRHQYSEYESGHQPRVKRINVSFDSAGWTGKLLVAAILAILVFFFLPVLLFILLAVGAVFMGVWLLRMLRR